MGTDGHVAMIMGTTRSGRVPEKNWQEICGRSCIDYTIENARAACIFTDIVVSMTSTARRFVGIVEDAGAVCLQRDSDWLDSCVDYTLARSLEKYERESGKRFESCTMLHGTSIFWRPSWIRTATRIVTNGRCTDVDERRISIVEADVQGCYVFGLDRHSANKIVFDMDHRGINVDINTPIDLERARVIMREIQNGTIDYPLVEDEHETPDVLRRILTANRSIELHE